MSTIERSIRLGLREIPSVAGVFGVHRFHHVAEDDRRCVSPASVAATAIAFQTFLVGALTKQNTAE